MWIPLKLDNMCKFASSLCTHTLSASAACSCESQLWWLWQSHTALHSQNSSHHITWSKSRMSQNFSMHIIPCCLKQEHNFSFIEADVHLIWNDRKITEYYLEICREIKLDRLKKYYIHCTLFMAKNYYLKKGDETQNLISSLSCT